MRHSPGPWQAHFEEIVRGYIADSRGCTVARAITTHALDQAEIIANARLIAAAPDLLACCQELYAWLPSEAVDAKTRILAVIKKANGREAVI